MDISQIKGEKINTVTGIKYGEDTAPKKIVEFINLRCPYCKKYWNDHLEATKRYVAEGKAQLIIKLFDKEKESLQRGNIMHHHITLDNADLAWEEIQKVFDTQEEWGNLSLPEVAEYATQNLGLILQENPQYVEEVIHEANVANVVFVPTVFIGEHIFDEHISEEEFAKFIEE
jgi:protein-disulfide isomerase